MENQKDIKNEIKKLNDILSSKEIRYNSLIIKVNNDNLQKHDKSNLLKEEKNIQELRWLINLLDKLLNKNKQIKN
jgi:hypothetical protein